MTTDIIIPDIETELASAGVTPDGVAAIRAGFDPHFAALAVAAEKARDVGDDPKKARLVRLELKNIRVAAEKVRKELKEDSLRRGKAIDGANNILLYALKPIESAMDDIEKAEERRKEAERQALIDGRAAIIRNHEGDPGHYALGDMDNAAFSSVVEGLKAAKAERERIAEEARQRAEAERIERERIAAEREAELARLRKEREEQERILAAERAEREAERKAEEARQAKIRAEAEAKAAEERKARELAEAEARRIREEAEAKERAERERAAAESARIAEEDRKRKAAPDVEKLRHMATAVRALEIPSLATSPGLAVEIAEQVEKFAAWLEAKAAKMGGAK